MEEENTEKREGVKKLEVSVERIQKEICEPPCGFGFQIMWVLCLYVC